MTLVAHTNPLEGSRHDGPVFLSTKIQAPIRRRTAIARIALVKRLSRRAEGKLTLLDAPPGWGKTSLLAEWMAAESGSRQFCWVSLDEHDNDSRRTATSPAHPSHPTTPGWLGACSGLTRHRFATVTTRQPVGGSEVEVTEATFNEDVIERSKEVPVVVDFWAEWCGPCRQLAPLIEAAVDARDGEVVLAKVNIDQNPALAQAAQVSSIPAVKAFVDGKVVDEFVGLVPPPQIDAFLNRLVPSKADKLTAEGDEASLREALEMDAGHLPARLALGRLLVGEGRAAEAREVLEPASFDSTAEGILARLDLAGVDTPDVAAGLAALDREDFDSALAHLIDAVSSADDELRELLRKTVVGIFGELGDQHPLVLKHRKRLARAIY